MKYLVIFIVLFGIFCVIILSAVIETGYYHLRIGEKYVSVVCNEKNPRLKLDDIDRQHPYSQIFKIEKYSNSLAILWIDSNSKTMYSIGEKDNRLAITDIVERTDKRWYVYQETSPPSWVTRLHIQSNYIVMYFLTRWGPKFSYLVSDSSDSISLIRSNPGKDKYTFVEHISSDVLQAISAHKLDSNIYLDINSNEISCKGFSKGSHHGEIENFGINMFPITVSESTFNHRGWIPILPETVNIDDLSPHWIIMNHDDGHLIYQLSSDETKYYILVYCISDDSHFRNWKIGIPTISTASIKTSVKILKEPLQETLFLFISDGNLKVINNQDDIPKSALKSTLEFKRTNNPTGSFTLAHDDKYLNFQDRKLLLNDENIPLWKLHEGHLYYDNERVALRDNQNLNIYQESDEESIPEPQNSSIELSKSSDYESEKFETPDESFMQSLELKTETETEGLFKDESATEIEQDVHILHPLHISIRSTPEQESSSSEQIQESEISFEDNVPNFPDIMRDLAQILPHR